MTDIQVPAERRRGGPGARAVSAYELQRGDLHRRQGSVPAARVHALTNLLIQTIPLQKIVSIGKWRRNGEDDGKPSPIPR